MLVTCIIELFRYSSGRVKFLQPYCTVKAARFYRHDFCLYLSSKRVQSQHSNNRKKCKMMLPGQAIDSRDLMIPFNNKLFRNPVSRAFERMIQELYTEEGYCCRVCGFHSRKHIARTSKGNTVITCLSCGHRKWVKR